MVGQFKKLTANDEIEKLYAYCYMYKKEIVFSVYICTSHSFS